jgi:hypothetical protein
MPAPSLLPVSLLLGVVSATGLTGALLSRPASAVELRCAPPQPGRYVVMGQGQSSGEPVARILQETWQPDGTLQGVRLERRGSRYAETMYTGSYRAISNCRAAISRSYGTATSPSQVVLDPQGYPRFSLGTLPDVLLISRWYRQPVSSCSSALLDGAVVSMQTGHSRKGQSWQENAVVQHEQWQQGQVKGIAVASFGPTIEEVTYKGSITVSPDCLATIRQVDSLGTVYNYRAVVRADGGGYLYLQTDPDNLTVGSLEHVQGR